MSPQSIQGESFLLTVVLVSLAFAGFVGIIQASGKDNKDRVQQHAGVEFILENTAAVCFLGLLPFPLFYGLSSEHRVWAISSVLLGIASFVIIVRHGYLIADLLRRNHKPRMLPWLKLILFITLGFGFLEVYNYYKQSLVIYTIGLLWLLVAAGCQFVSSFRFLLSTKSSSAE